MDTAKAKPWHMQATAGRAKQLEGLLVLTGGFSAEPKIIIRQQQMD